MFLVTAMAFLVLSWNKTPSDIEVDKMFGDFHFCPVLSGNNRTKLEEIGFFQFFPPSRKKQVSSGKKTNPATGFQETERTVT